MVSSDAGGNQLASHVRLAVAGRGEHFEPYLLAALASQFKPPAYIDAEISTAQRLLVAGATFRPGLSSWRERYFKSSLSWRLRTRRANAGLRRLGDSVDVVLQDHGLFGNDHPRSVMLVDNTHQQSVDNWPEWNPLNSRQLSGWLGRERAQYHRQAHIFTLCQAAATSLVEDYGVPTERVSVVGAGPNLHKLPEPRVYRDPPVDPVILFVGNDFRRKGGNVLLAAFSEVRRSIPAATLVIAGAQRPSTVPPGVDFLGRVRDPAVMAGLYTTADVFCLPSLFEPFALALIEAMAYGLASVATVTGGIPEMITDGDNGMLVQPGDERALAKALISVLTEPGLAARLGRAGRARVDSTYQWRHVVDRMRPVLERVGARQPSYSPDASAFMTPSSGSASSPRTP